MTKNNQANNQNHTAPTTGRAFRPIRVGDGKEATAWVKVGRHTISVDGRIGKGELRLSQLLKSSSGRKALVEIAKVDRECNLAVRETLGKEVSTKLGIDRSHNLNPLLTMGMSEQRGGQTPSSREEAITALAKLIIAANPMQVLSVKPMANPLIGQPPVEVKTFTVRELLTLAEENGMTVEQVLESIISELSDSRVKGDFEGDQICAVELNSLVDKAKDTLVSDLQDRLKSGDLTDRLKLGELGNPINALKGLADCFKGFGSSVARGAMAGRAGRSMGGHGPVGRVLTGFETELDSGYAGNEPRLPTMDLATARNALVNALFDGGGVDITSFSNTLTMNPEFAKAVKFGLFSASMKRETGRGVRARFNKAGKLFDKKARKAGKKIKITT